ncbi:alpha/beta hydrolase fold [Actinopolymorpha cephalotaxi]|uniref:Alpha/beta hydrolase fold n=1 Tax=Actinopolymorpha cephalotaxi TaxID=504797 RepID=A0A1I3ARK0_9ACTN|nr:alpha/beta hydrolase fold [Actinopolymorpha cephalotaxi]
MDLVYDVAGPLPAADGRPPLLMIGQPMDASGFRELAGYFPDRTVVTYDPRGGPRSVRKDGRGEQTPQDSARDVHAVIEAVGGGPVHLFASSGGAVVALALVAAFPNHVAVLVAHEPPMNPVLPDAAAAHRARAHYLETYQAKGVEDDGSRDNPLLSGLAVAITDYHPDVAALTASPTRVVIAVGEETGHVYTARTARTAARVLGQEATSFPSHHLGFVGGLGRPEEFAARLREVLDAE